jgi:hypothetical protein
MQEEKNEKDKRGLVTFRMVLPLSFDLGPADVMTIPDSGQLHVKKT